MVFFIQQFPKSLHAVIHIAHQTYLFPFWNRKSPAFAELFLTFSFNCIYSLARMR